MCYTIIDWLFTAGSIVLAIILPHYLNNPTYCLVGIALYFIYPIPMELVYDLGAQILFSKKDEQKRASKVIEHIGLPIVYSPKYNITACGLEKLHPFDSCKYQRVVEDLNQGGVLQQRMFDPKGQISRGLLLSLGMSWSYLMKLCYSYCVFRIVEIPICFLPGPFLRQQLLNPMLQATQGTIDAAILAVRHGWSINIGGGYHHASLQNGGGFCVYPDITLAVKYVREYFMKTKVAIVDLDAHQGNGHERDFLNDPDVYILDVYNHHIYPGDSLASNAIKLDVEVDSSDTDTLYLQKVSNSVRQVLKDFEPEYLIYNAGTDCMNGDPLGGMRLSAQAIMARDKMMFELCRNANVPILMVLSGGYQRANAPTIAASIIYLLSKLPT